MDQQPFIITIVGAESSGKTTLARKLAEYYGCPWVQEYAREYLEGLDRPYMPEDLYSIADIQIERILSVLKDVMLIDNGQWAMGNRQWATGNRQSLVGRGQFSGSSSNMDVFDDWYARFELNDQIPGLIIDGGMLTLRMWARIKYGIMIPVVEEALLNDVTSLYLLCRPLKDWEPDPMREAPDLLDRAWIYNQYLKELAENKFPFQIVPSTSV